MAITHGRMPANSAEFPSWVPIVAIIAGSVFTFLIGVWRASRQQDRAVTHGVLVAVGAVALHLVTSTGAGRPITSRFFVADLLKLVAGFVAGEIARRRRTLSTATI